MPDTIQVDVYSRADCHLCDAAKEVIERVQQRMPFSLRMIDIGGNPQLEAAYGEEIPVIVINGVKAFRYRVKEVEFEKRMKSLWKT